MTESLKPSPYDQENKGLAQPGNFDPAAGDRTSPQLADRRPLAIDLFSGLGGWAEGLDAEGYDVIRVDIEDMFLATGTPKPIPCLLMLQDVMTIHGSQFKHAETMRRATGLRVHVDPSARYILGALKPRNARAWASHYASYRGGDR